MQRVNVVEPVNDKVNHKQNSIFRAFSDAIAQYSITPIAPRSLKRHASVIQCVNS